MQGGPVPSFLVPVISWITLPNPDHQPTMPQSRSLLKSSLCPEAVVALVLSPTARRPPALLSVAVNSPRNSKP